MMMLNDEPGDERDDSKRKSRNLSEKKRRDQFNLLVNELSSMVSSTNRKMDKSTVLKSTITFLRNHNEIAVRSKIHEIHEDWKPSFLSNEEFTHLILEALDGFILVFSTSGRIYYASESITSLLGYLPNDLLNMSIYDLAYEEDYSELYNLLQNPPSIVDPVQDNISVENQVCFSCHIKRGGLDLRDEISYELVQFVGYFRSDLDIENINLTNSKNISYLTDTEESKLLFVGTSRIQKPQLIREMSIIGTTKSEFTSRHSLEWKFLFLDHRAPPIIGYLPFEVLGTSGYDYYHFDDLEKMVLCHQSLKQKGEETSCYYRFLTKGQQWIWLQTRYYITYHQWTSKPEFVVCTHRVINYADVMQQIRNNENKLCGVGSGGSGGGGGGRGGGSGNGGVGGTTAGGGAEDDSADSIDRQINSSSMAVSPWSNQSSRSNSRLGNNHSSSLPRNKSQRHHTFHGSVSESTFISIDSPTSNKFSSQNNSRSKIRVSSKSLKTSPQHYPDTSHDSQQLQHQDNHHHHHHLQHQSKVNQQMSSSGGGGGGGGGSGPPSVSTHILHHNNSPIKSPSQIAPVDNNISGDTGQNCTTDNTSQYLASLTPTVVIAAAAAASTATYSNNSLSAATATVLAPISSNVLPDVLHSGLVMTSTTQTIIQDQLQRKHEELQQLIVHQQDELRRVSEQLVMARYGLPMVNVSSLPYAPPSVANIPPPIKDPSGISATVVRQHQQQQQQLQLQLQQSPSQHHPRYKNSTSISESSSPSHHHHHHHPHSHQQQYQHSHDQILSTIDLDLHQQSHHLQNENHSSRMKFHDTQHLPTDHHLPQQQQQLYPHQQHPHQQHHQQPQQHHHHQQHQQQQQQQQHHHHQQQQLLNLSSSDNQTSNEISINSANDEIISYMQLTPVSTVNMQHPQYSHFFQLQRETINPSNNPNNESVQVSGCNNDISDNDDQILPSTINSAASVTTDNEQPNFELISSYSKDRSGIQILYETNNSE